MPSDKLDPLLDWVVLIAPGPTLVQMFRPGVMAVPEEGKAGMLGEREMCELGVGGRKGDEGCVPACCAEDREMPVPESDKPARRDSVLLISFSHSSCPPRALFSLVCMRRWSRSGVLRELTGNGMLLLTTRDRASEGPECAYELPGCEAMEWPAVSVVLRLGCVSDVIASGDGSMPAAS